MDYKQAILKKLKTLPAEMLPQIHRLCHDIREQRFSVQQILARANEMAALESVQAKMLRLSNVQSA